MKIVRSLHSPSRYQHRGTRLLLRPVVLAFFIFLTCPVAHSQCSSNQDLADNFIATLNNASTPDSSGIYTVYYGFADSSGHATGAAVAEPFTEGFNDWNDYADVTGVRFAPAAAGTMVDVDLKQVPVGVCIQGRSDTATIQFDSDFLGRSNADGQSTIAVAHEIAHLLGGDDKPPNSTPPSILNHASGTSCGSASSNATQISDSDASAVTSCQQQARTKCKDCNK